MALVNIMDRSLFPLLVDCPQDASGTFYMTKDGRPWIPTCHICILAELVERVNTVLFLCTVDFAQEVNLKNSSDKHRKFNLMVQLYFLNEDLSTPETPRYDHKALEIGNTVVLLYPRTRFHDKLATEVPDKFFIRLTDESEMTVRTLAFNLYIDLTQDIVDQSPSGSHRTSCSASLR